MLHRPPPSAKPRPPPSSRRAADARYRARVRAGRMTAVVELDGEILDMLIRLRWLGERDAADRGKVGCAIARMLADAAKR